MYQRQRYTVVTLSWFALTLCLSLFIPNIGDIIALAGGFAAIFIFVLPGCLHDKYQLIINEVEYFR